MDFDIAGLLADPDFQYMLAGIGAGMGQRYDNPFAQAAGGITMQSIGAKNQAALLARLLGQGGKGEGVSVGSGYDKVSKQFLGADPATKISSDGKTATFTGPVGAFEGFGGSSTPAVNPSSGGQSGIINPSVGLPGDLSGLSLAGLKPEDVNKAITLGLTGANLERKRVSDLYVNAYHQALVNEKIAARGAKEVSAPIEIPGIGQVTLPQYNALPAKTKVYAYAMQLRKQNGQGIISPEQFDRETDPASMERLVERAMTDPNFKDMWFKSKAAGATQINLGNEAARQEQKNAINNFDSLKKPEHAKLFDLTEGEQRTIRRSIDTTLGNKEYDQAYNNALTKAKIDKALALVKGTGVEILEKETKLKDNELIIPVITKTGARDVIRRTIR